MTAIVVRLPDESVKLDNVEERRVLTDLEVIYEGGMLDGKTQNFPTRDLERVVVGLHLPNWNFFETYERTICVDIRSHRTIFRYAGITSKSPTISSLVEEAARGTWHPQTEAHRNMKFFTRAHHLAFASISVANPFTTGDC